MKKIGLFIVMAIFAVMTSFADEMTSFMKVPFSATKSEIKQILIENGFKVKDKVGTDKNQFTKETFKYNYLKATKKDLTYANEPIRNGEITFNFDEENNFTSLYFYYESSGLENLTRIGKNWETIKTLIITKYDLKIELENDPQYSLEFNRIVTDGKNVVVVFSKYEIHIKTYKEYLKQIKKREDATKSKVNDMIDDL